MKLEKLVVTDKITDNVSQVIFRTLRTRRMNFKNCQASKVTKTTIAIPLQSSPGLFFRTSFVFIVSFIDIYAFF